MHFDKRSFFVHSVKVHFQQLSFCTISKCKFRQNQICVSAFLLRKIMYFDMCRFVYLVKFIQSKFVISEMYIWKSSFFI